ncbi:MAG: TonB family protein [Cyclobacteriaceae bacterium]|nr:MAG: TonB family protein [Cyclobacteriaceae bacterium]
MTDYTHDIKRYLIGAMTPQERHAFEKKVLADPFLAEALEGAEQLSATEFQKDVEALNKQILEVEIEQEVAAASSSKKVAAAAPALKRAKVQKIEQTRVSVFSWTLRIAAGLVIVLVSGYLIWQVTQPNENQEALAMEESTPPPTSLPDTSLYKDDAGEQAVAETIVDAKPDESIAGGTSSSSSSSKKTETEKTQEDSGDLGYMVQPSEPLITETKPVEITPALDVKADEVIREKLVVEKEEKAKLAEAIQRETNDAAKKQVAGRAMAAPTTGPKVIRGKVTSTDDGSPLPGVNVIVKGTSIGTTTDEGGNYQIATDITNPVLIYAFIGLQTTEINAGTRSEIDVSLAQDVTQLSEVVVTGYGTQRSDDSYTPTVELAYPENGNRAFKQYLEKNMVYPEDAKTQKIEGRVTVDFFVEPDGSLTGFTIIRGIGGGCDEELIRLIKEGPKWIPTKRDNTPVRDKVRVRLKFELPK